MVEVTQEYQRNVARALQMAREAADVTVRRQWLNTDEWTMLAKARMERFGLRAIGKDRMQRPKSA